MKMGKWSLAPFVPLSYHHHAGTNHSPSARFKPLSTTRERKIENRRAAPLPFVDMELRLIASLNSYIEQRSYYAKSQKVFHTRKTI